MMDQGECCIWPSGLDTAAFILLRARGDVFGYAFGVVILANTLMASLSPPKLVYLRRTKG